MTAQLSRISWGMSNKFMPHAAFAAVLADGTLVRWGNPGSGNDSTGHSCLGSAVACSTSSCYLSVFAPVLDGTVVTFRTLGVTGLLSRIS